MVCVPQLVSALRNDTPEKTTWTRLCDIIESHFKGDLRHVTDTLSLLWKTVNQDDDPTTTATSGSTSSVRLFLACFTGVRINAEFWQVTPPGIDNSESWAVLRAAMIKSIREGTFLDRKYWAQHSKKGSLTAVYFSSLIAGDGLEACEYKAPTMCIFVSELIIIEGITYLNNKPAPGDDPVGEVDAESDCESDSIEPDDRVEEGHEDEEIRLFLSPGSYSA